MKVSRIAARAAWPLVAVVLVSVPPVLAEEVIRSGPDVWETSGSLSYSNFARDPIPAGFFCPDSKAFTGKVTLKGKPLATQPIGALGPIDTIVHRLDDARFDESGVAKTRIQLLALSLTSASPIDTGCGLYDMDVSLAGDQPVTEMTIIRKTERGGSYVAPLALDTRIVFTPVAGGKQLQLRHRVDLGPGTNSVWSFATQEAARHAGLVKIDTDGDRKPDAILPRESNFLAGVEDVQLAATSSNSYSATPRLCPITSCHCTPQDNIPPPQPGQPNSGCEESHMHCVTVWVQCPPVQAEQQNAL